MTSDDAWLGLADPDSLVLERPSAAPDWPRTAHVDVDGDDLAFWWARVERVPGGYRAAPGAEATTPGPGLLASFVRLESAPVGKILAFAKRWGALEICAHNLPRAHPPMGRHPRATYLCEERRLPQGGEPIGHLESLAVWRYLARRIRLLLELAEGLWREPPALGDAEVWESVHRHPPSDSASARHELSAGVNAMVQLGQVRVWSAPTPPYVRVGGHDLFGALALQLLLVTSKSAGWATCSHCARPYAPTRRPQSGRLNYCPLCRAAGIPNRVAAHNYRASRSTGTGRAKRGE
jgi:hypothetical protein